MASQNIDDYIQPLHINGLTGRMLYMPAPAKQAREMLVVYGHHSSLERWWGLAQAFNQYGAIIMPDLPGFGGMDSFYKIGRKATLDNYADYLAAFVKMRYKRRRVTLIGISFGFLVVTRMLQRYPELAEKVDVLISAVGFMHHDDFRFTPTRHRLYIMSSRLIAVPPIDYIFRAVGLNKYVLRSAYAQTHNAKVKFAQAGSDRALFDAMMDMEIKLWHANHVRTHFKTTVEMLTVDNCADKIDLPVWHIYTENDNYFDNTVVEQRMRVVFNDYFPAQMKSSAHAPSVIASKQESKQLIPKELHNFLKPPRAVSRKKKPKKRDTPQ